MSVQKNLKKIRTAKGVTQKAIAEFVGMHEMSYSRLENESKRIDPEVLVKAAKFLGVSINIFFDNKLTDSVIGDLEPNKEVSK